MVKHLPANAGDMGSIPGPGRSHMPSSNQACVPAAAQSVHVEPVLHTREAPTMRSRSVAGRVAPALAVCETQPRHK